MPRLNMRLPISSVLDVGISNLDHSLKLKLIDEQFNHNIM